MKHSKKLLGGLAVIASAGLMVGTTVPANADPARPYAAVGSDTIQDVWNALTNDDGAGAPISSVASWNAFDNTGNANLIQTKTGGAWFVRPKGSGNGVIALTDTWDAAAAAFSTTTAGLTVAGGAITSISVAALPHAIAKGAVVTLTSGTNTQSWTLNADALSGATSLTVVSQTPNFDYPSGTTIGLPSKWNGVALSHQEADFARSSSGPKISGTDLSYIPFARDAVGIAFNQVGSLSGGLNLTTSEIQSLYSGQDVAGDQVTFDGSGNPLLNGTPVHPKVPQQGSGTRSFFLGAIQVGDGVSGHPGLASYITDAPLPGGFPENNGTAISNDGDLIPFSAAQWIAQNNGAPGVTNTTGGDAMATINGLTAVTGSAGSMAPGTLYGSATAGKYNSLPPTGLGAFARDTYVVVPTSFKTGTAKQTTLVGLLSTATGVAGGTAVTTIKAYGFGQLGYVSTQANWKGAAWQHS